MDTCRGFWQLDFACLSAAVIDRPAVGEFADEKTIGIFIALSLLAYRLTEILEKNENHLFFSSI